MNFFKKILSFIRQFKPRYHLSLDSHFYNLSKKVTSYRFKVFGDHSFPTFTFEDIILNKNILYDINPTDLIKIITIDYNETHKKNEFKIKSILRNNKYKVSNDQSEETFTGEEICESDLLIEKIKKSDLYKIAYNTGFIHGRQIKEEIIYIEQNKSDAKNPTKGQLVPIN